MAKIEILKFCLEYLSTTLRVKKFAKIALYLTVSEILTYFRLLQKFKMAAKVVKIEILKFCLEYFSTTLRVQNSVKITLSLTVSEILTPFSRKNSRWPPKVAKI